MKNFNKNVASVSLLTPHGLHQLVNSTLLPSQMQLAEIRQQNFDNVLIFQIYEKRKRFVIFRKWKKL